MKNTMTFLGVGIYGIAEASRLTGVPASTVRRWVKGYKYDAGGEERSAPPVWAHQLPEVEGTLALGFRDLIEIRVVHALREEGVSWRTIKLSQQHAAKMLGSDHPFATGRFKTDGRDVFAYVATRTHERALIDLSHNQIVFRRFVEPSLTDVEFNKKDEAARWWPMGAKRRVLLDPARSFGRPIVREGVPTEILARAVSKEDSNRTVARWFEVPLRSVRDAVEFERQLAA